MKLLLPFCECGCNKRIKTPGKHFLWGHNSRVLSANTLRKRSESLKKVVHTPEWNAKVAKAHIGLGHPISDITKKKLSKINKGKLISQETRRKISEALKGRRLWSDADKEQMSHQRKGRTLSEEHKKKIRKAMIGLKRGPMCEEHKRKLSSAHKGQSPSWKGGTLSMEWREKLRLAAIRRIESQKFDNQSLSPNIGSSEKYCLDILQKFCPYEIKLQFPIIAYFLDGYIPELNIAIEFDERAHERRTEKDAQRQAEIVDELGCLFFRIKERDWESKSDEVIREFQLLLKYSKVKIAQRFA